MADEQRTADWFHARMGRFTGSTFADVMARNKRTGEPLKAYWDLIWKLAVERLSGEPIEGPDGIALRWGREVEPFAREAYELETGNLVEEVGFIQHPKFSFAGCSPDGTISTDGGIELKSPKDSAIHMQRLIDGIPEEYVPQCQGFLWVTGRDWIDFASFDPRMPERFRLIILRQERDESFISKLEQAVIEAEQHVQATIKKLEDKIA